MTKLVDVFGDALVATWREGDARMVRLEDIRPKAALYLLQYGLNQTTQDAVASLGARLKAIYPLSKAGFLVDGKVDAKAQKDWAKACEDAGLALDHTKSEDEFTDMVLAARKDARFADILAEKMEAPTSSTRLVGIDRIMADVAMERLRAKMARANVKMPKDDRLEKALAIICAKEGDDIRAEAQRRIDAATASAEGNDDDLLAAMRGTADTEQAKAA